MGRFIKLSFAALIFAAGATAQIAGGSATSGSFAGSAPGVAGAPYSAEQVTERVQTLADGTHITQTVHTLIYRDSQGRSRTEHSSPMPAGSAAPTIIEIADPVSGSRYMLNSRDHTAQKLSLPKALPPPPPSSATAQARSPITAPAPQITHESLGNQMIEGLLVEGTRITTVHPVGAYGNDRPVTTTTEIWRSPELRVMILTKSSDLRFGDSTTKLTNISRAEPDPALFQIPADYKIVDPEAGPPGR